jgi:hypothetical protein
VREKNLLPCTREKKNGIIPHHPPLLLSLGVPRFKMIQTIFFVPQFFTQPEIPFLGSLSSTFFFSKLTHTE